MALLDVGMGSATRTGSLDKPDKQIKGSIVKSKYKKEYRKLGGLCGDEVSAELTAATLLPGKDAKVSLEKLKEIAVLNGVWKDSYVRLNAGQQRMTVGNCLRNKMARGDKITIGQRTMGGYEE